VDTAIDLEMAGYVLVTYRASQLRPEVLAAMETVVFTRGSPAEIRAVSEGFGPPGETGSWGAILGDLDLGDAAAVSREVGGWGQMTQVRLAPRITAHVRNRNKYFHIPMDEGPPFVFTGADGRVIARSHSLRDLCFALAWVNTGSVPRVSKRRKRSTFRGKRRPPSTRSSSPSMPVTTREALRLLTLVMTGERAPCRNQEGSMLQTLKSASP
jgi:hypothetical protein